MSGPRPRPPMFAAVAASDARRSPGLSSVSAAVAVPVTRPADSPDRTRPTASTPTSGARMNSDRAQRTGAEGHGQHRLAPGLIRGPARQQQGGQHAGRVHRVDHRHDGGGEMPLVLVDDVQRGGQRGAEHGGAEHECHQPERDPAVGGPPAGLGGRRRNRHALAAGVRTGVVHVSSRSSSPASIPALCPARADLSSSRPNVPGSGHRAVSAARRRRPFPRKRPRAVTAQPPYPQGTRSSPPGPPPCPLPTR